MYILRTEKEGGDKLMFMPFEIVNICVWLWYFFQKHLYLMKCICSAQSENLDNSGIALRKVKIPKLADRVRILTLRGTIPELSVRKVRIRTK